MALPNNFSSTLIAGTDQANTIATRVMNLQSTIADITGAPVGITINKPIATFNSSTGLITNFSISAGSEGGGFNITDSDESDTWRIAVNGGEDSTDPRFIIQHLSAAGVWIDVLRVSEGVLWHKFLDEIGSGTTTDGSGVTKINTLASGGLFGGGSGELTMGIGALGITNAMLGTDCVDGYKIADNAVGAAHIAAGQVITSKIADLAVTAAKISGGGETTKVLTSTGSGVTWAAPGSATRHYDVFDWSGTFPAASYLADNTISKLSIASLSTHTAGDGKVTTPPSDPSRFVIGENGTWRITAYCEWDVPAAGSGDFGGSEGPTALILTHHKTGWDNIDKRHIAWSMERDSTENSLRDFTGLTGLSDPLAEDMNKQSATVVATLRIATGDLPKHFELSSYHKAHSPSFGRKVTKVQVTAEWLGT